MIIIKSEEEIKLISEACQILHAVFAHLKQLIKPKITTRQLDREAEQLLQKLNAESAFKGYHGYPANICTSVNEEVVHGIPDRRKLKEGDILSLDIGVNLNGYFSDAAYTFAVGEIAQPAKRLLRVAQQALYISIDKAYPGNHLSDISYAIQSHAHMFGYSVVRKFVGHGVGLCLHEEPEIPNFGYPGNGPILKTGMVLAIETMVNEGTYEVEILKNNWTAVTKDKRLSAHFEHTICITSERPAVLTSWGE